MITAWKRWRREQESQDLFLILWAVLIFLFFSVSSSKLAPYMLPVCPPLAMLIANRFSIMIEENPGNIKITAITTGLLVLLPGMLFISAAYLPSVQGRLSSLLPAGITGFITGYQPIYHVSIAGLIGICLTLLALALLGLSFLNIRSPIILLILVALSGTTLTYGSRTIYEKAIAPGLSSRTFAAEINRQFRDGDLIAALGYEQGINYYTGKRALIVLDKGELEFGSKQGNQSEWFITPHKLMSIWLSEQRIFCSADKVILRLFPFIFKESQIIARRGDRVLLLNRP